MDDEKGPKSGTYTQIPNVFFDTCDLPESAQILYLRLYRHIAYKDEHKFAGSIRKLSSFVRLSKSTVDRMIKVLEESRLINISYELSRDQDCKVMAITINPQELWILNKQHHEEKDVPNWDKSLPDAKVLSQIGTLCPDMGQDDLKLGQSVPDVSSKSAQESISTENELNEGMKKGEHSHVTKEISTLDQNEAFSHSFTHSSKSSPKPNKRGYLKAPMREVLKAIGDSQTQEYHFDRVHKLWLECAINDIEAFRDGIFKAKVQATGKDMEYFYRCLERAVKVIEQT